MVAIVFSSALFLASCDKDKVLEENAGAGGPSFSSASFNGTVTNQNGILHFSCADDYENYHSFLRNLDAASTDSLDGELEAVEADLLFTSLRSVVFNQGIQYENSQRAQLLATSGDTRKQMSDYFESTENQHPDEEEVILDYFERSIRNPDREVMVKQSYIVRFSPETELEIVNPDPAMIAQVRGALAVGAPVPQSVLANPTTIVHPVTYPITRKIILREVQNNQVMAIAPYPTACGIYWTLDGVSYPSNDPVIILPKGKYTDLTVECALAGQSFITSTFLPVTCGEYTSWLGVEGLKLEIGEECGEVEIKYDFGTYNHPVLSAYIDFGDGGSQSIPLNGVPNGSIFHTYQSGQPYNVVLDVTRGIADLPGTHCIVSVSDSITPDLSGCCVGDSEVGWAWYKNTEDEDHKLRARFRIRTNWLGTTKYITRGRYKKGIWRRSAKYNAESSGDKYISTPLIECGVYTSHSHNPGQTRKKRWFRDVDGDRFITYRHFEESIDFELEGARGGYVTTAEKSLPKD